MEKLTNEAACDALYLIQPKQEVLDELEITYDCEDNKELVTPKEELCETSPQRDGDVNMVMPIKTELILSDDLAQLHTRQQLSDHGNVPHVLQIKGERDTEASVAADCAPARDSTLLIKSPQSQSIGAAANKELFTCNVCQKQLKYKSALVFHMRTHTGEKPFSCDRCQRKFIERSKLTRHVRTHSGEKPFTCDICKKRFTENVIHTTLVAVEEGPHNAETSRVEHRLRYTVGIDDASTPCTIKMDRENLIDDKLKRKRELTNARVKRYRQKKCTELQQLNTSIQDDFTKAMQNEQLKKFNAERKRTLAKERSRRYREKKRLVLKSVHRAVNDSITDGNPPLVLINQRTVIHTS